MFDFGNKLHYRHSAYSLNIAVRGSSYVKFPFFTFMAASERKSGSLLLRTI